MTPALASGTSSHTTTRTRTSTSTSTSTSTTSTAAPSHPAVSLPRQRRGRRRRPSISLLSRNVDTVVLGNVQFETWYYSPYPDSIILSPSPLADQSQGQGPGQAAATAAGSPTSPAASILCSILYVCPYCFCYTPHGSEYVRHLGGEEKKRRRRSRDPEPKAVPDSATPVYSYGGYCVWEIDGETEKLYCQNLSLFGKLFLEQKSVFFDTAGFLYYVLTYTSPGRRSQPPIAGMDLYGGQYDTRKYAHNRGRLKQGTTGEDDLDLMTARTEILGFFSKENPSWDSNNLACILIFPPYQHRQLGKLLMSVSYKLSGWEWEGGVIGGPEKPLSTMGRRSYYRFWSERVARFILGESADADGRKVLEAEEETTWRKKKKNVARKEALTIREIGERTGMLAEDVAAALAEMGVCELGSPKEARVNKMNEASNGSRVGGKVSASTGTGNDVEDVVPAMVVKRSRVLEWVQKNGVNPHDPVREEGFLGEWAMSEANADETDI